MSVFESFVRKHDFLVCVDSDGCVMDTMNCKHFHCFGPCLVRQKLITITHLYPVWRPCKRGWEVPMCCPMRR